jgi:predicted DNA-binding transcriptional regulator AlpA
MTGEPLLLRPGEAAAFLGMSRVGFWRADRAGILGPRAVHVSGPRFRRQELEDWVARGCPPRSRWTWPAAAGEARA